MSTYRERLTAPASWWVTALAFGLVCGWILLVATSWTAGIVAAVVGTAIAVGLVWAYGSVVVTAGPDGLDVSGTHLAPEHLGNVVVLDRRAFRDRLGPDADARAWLRTRPYVDGGILVEVADPADPTPYWLVSCRRPQAVVDALGHTEDASTTNGDAHRGEEEV